MEAIIVSKDQEIISLKSCIKTQKKELKDLRESREISNKKMDGTKSALFRSKMKKEEVETDLMNAQHFELDESISEIVAKTGTIDSSQNIFTGPVLQRVGNTPEFKEARISLRCKVL